MVGRRLKKPKPELFEQENVFNLKKIVEFAS